ncbi:hypothetical protein E1176_03985 [Fulvivirga sp. RKSG066]|uniref:hypothetical protein n=1 Tax=Fulvivirga aurantia TaxID=2529383 RepID=UPI0012BD5521|nr:hypothetical protein [Fulvivirga aurantia]MTI20170.1 hypothetical protein [Fulvivirga aurantia]
MAKRQKRFDTIASIRDNYAEISGKKVNIVLKNRSTLFATLTELNEDSIVVINVRAGKTKIALQDISEIILDFNG